MNYKIARNAAYIHEGQLGTAIPPEWLVDAAIAPSWSADSMTECSKSSLSPAAQRFAAAVAQLLASEHLRRDKLCREVIDKSGAAVSEPRTAQPIEPVDIPFSESTCARSPSG